MSEGNTSLSDLIIAGGKTRNIANIILFTCSLSRSRYMLFLVCDLCRSMVLHYIFVL